MNAPTPPPNMDAAAPGVRPANAWAPGGLGTDEPIVPGGDPNALEEPNGFETTAAPLCPNKADIAAHLYALFPPTFVQPYPAAWIEIAYADPAIDEVNAAKNFSAFDLQAATEFAEKKNRAGFNIYVGPALRHGAKPSSGRAGFLSVLTASHSWVEFDKPGDDARIGAILKEKNLATSMIVVTGRTPCLRAHLYFRLTGSATPAELKEANEALKTLLGTDAVQDANRVLRLAGTVSYPPPKKVERGYVAELVTIEIRKAPAYTIEQLTGAAPRRKGYGETPERPAPTAETFFKEVNQLALLRLSSWVKPLFGEKVKFYRSTGAWRITSKDLGRNLEEDLSISQRGVYDFGTEKASSPINLVMEYGPTNSSILGPTLSDRDAAFWLCKRMGIDPEALGWGTRERRSADDPGYAGGYDYKASGEQDGQSSANGSESTAEQKAPAADPIDLWAKFDPPTLPRRVLPEVIEAFAFDQGMAMGCDMGGLAVSALAVCAAAIPDSIKLQPKKHDTNWVESARLWVAPVGSPSTMKSPMIAAAAKPRRRIDNEMARDNQEAMDDWHRLPKEKQRQTPQPKQTRLMIEDTTIEAAQEILKDSPNGVLSYQDELSGWFGAMDKYSGGKGAAKDRGFWLQSFNGGSYSVNRIGRGSLVIPNLSVSMLGSIQPEPIRKLAADGVDDGLLQRLIPIVLSPGVKGRDEPPSAAVDDYNALISNLHRLRPPTTGGILPAVVILKFDDGALAIREELEVKHLELQQCEAINRKLGSHIGKYNGLFARLCVVFHCVEHAKGP
jgi:hypothetical protein